MKSFDASAVAVLLAGSTKHEYSHRKVSKENLADALRKMSEAVSTLFTKSDEQKKQLEEEKKLRTDLEESQRVLSLRLLEAEQGLKQANKKMLEQKQDLLRETRKNADLIAELDATRNQMREEVNEHEVEIQRLHRATDRQQSVLQVLKLDVATASDVSRQALALAQEGGGAGVSGASGNSGTPSTGGNSGESEKKSGSTNNRSAGAKSAPMNASAGVAVMGTDGLRVSSEQVFCQNINLSTGQVGEDLIPLARLMEAVASKLAMLEKSKDQTADAMLDVQAELGKRAFDEDLAHLGKQFNFTCQNLDGLLRGFYEAGLFLEAPPSGSICDAVVQPRAPASPTSKTSAKIGSSKEVSDHDNKLQEIRSSYQSAPSGAYRINRGMRDLPQRFEAEVNVLSEVLNATTTRLARMQADIDTKLDADGVDSKIEVKFDEVIEELDKAIASAGADEEEFKRAAQELQDMCSTLSQSKADQSEVLDIRKRLELDARMRDKVELLQKYMEEKLSRTEADDLMSAKVAKDELGVKLAMLHRRLKAEIGLAIDEHQGVKPWVIGRPLSPGPNGPHSHQDPLTCLACNRKITPGQMDLLRRAPAIHNTLMNRQPQNGLSSPILSKGKRRQQQLQRGVQLRTNRNGEHVAPFTNDIDAQDWEALKSPTITHNQAEVQRISSTLPALVDRPKTVASVGNPFTRAQGQPMVPPQTAPSKTQGDAIAPLWPEKHKSTIIPSVTNEKFGDGESKTSPIATESKVQADGTSQGDVIEQVRIQNFQF